MSAKQQTIYMTIRIDVASTAESVEELQDEILENIVLAGNDNWAADIEICGFNN